MNTCPKKEWKASTAAFETFWDLCQAGWLTLLFKSILFFVVAVFFGRLMLHLQSRVLVQFYGSPNSWSISPPALYHPPNRPKQWPRSPLLVLSWSPSSLPFILTCLLLDARVPRWNNFWVSVRIKLNTFHWSMLYALIVGDFAIFTASKPYQFH